MIVRLRILVLFFSSLNKTYVYFKTMKKKCILFYIIYFWIKFHLTEGIPSDKFWRTRIQTHFSRHSIIMFGQKSFHRKNKSPNVVSFLEIFFVYTPIGYLFKSNFFLLLFVCFNEIFRLFDVILPIKWKILVMDGLFDQKTFLNSKHISRSKELQTRTKR